MYIYSFELDFGGISHEINASISIPLKNSLSKLIETNLLDLFFFVTSKDFIFYYF